MSLLKLPLEIHAQIINYLPTSYTWRLRRVCRKLKEQYESDIVVDKAFKSSGLNEVDGTMDFKLSLLKNRTIGRPAKSEDVLIHRGFGEFRYEVRLCGDHAAVVSCGVYNSMLTVVNLISGHQRFYLFFDQVACTILLSNTITGIATNTSIAWFSGSDPHRRTIPRPLLLRSGELARWAVIRVHKSTFATLILDEGLVESLWTYDTISTGETVQPINLSIAPGGERTDVSFSFDERYFTIFYVDTVAAHVVRYTKDNLKSPVTWQLGSIPDPTICRIDHLGKDEYRVSIRPTLYRPSTLEIDVAAGRLNRRTQSAATWNNYGYQQVANWLACYERDGGVISQLVTRGLIGTHAVSSHRYLIYASMTEEGLRLQVLDFYGETKLERRIEGDHGWKWWPKNSSTNEADDVRLRDWLGIEDGRARWTKEDISMI